MPNPESYFLLKGVVQENNQFIAFVEDKQTGSVLRLRQGDRVARGTVKSLTLDGLEYELARTRRPRSAWDSTWRAGTARSRRAIWRASRRRPRPPPRADRLRRRPRPRMRPRFSSGSWSSENNNWDNR